jgi:hypothetical protein
MKLEKMIYFLYIFLFVIIVTKDMHSLNIQKTTDTNISSNSQAQSGQHWTRGIGFGNHVQDPCCGQREQWCDQGRNKTEEHRKPEPTRPPLGNRGLLVLHRSVCIALLAGSTKVLPCLCRISTPVLLPNLLYLWHLV